MSSGEQVQTASADRARKRIILVVEDEVLVRAMIADALRDEGYSVIEAVNAEEALTLLRSPLSVDLVLTDMRMPDPLNGAELAYQIRTEFPFTRVAMVSAETPDDALRRALDGYLPKPFTPSAICAYVRALAPPIVD